MREKLRPAASRAMRYAGAAVGPVGGAIAQFLLSIQMLHQLPPAAFGVFSFLLVTFQFTTGVWSALFIAPLSLLQTHPDESRRNGSLRCLLAANLVLCGATLGCFALLGGSLGTGASAAAIFALYAAVALARTVARAHAYAAGCPQRTILSDLLYGVALLAGVGVLAAARPATLGGPAAALLAAAAAGMLPFGWRYLARQFAPFGWRELRGYGGIWRRHAGWSLVGVITTEATNNAHAYLVTLISGPAAFAPVAASALLIRPIGVVQNALGEFERPAMARQINAGHSGAAIAAMRPFRLVLIAAWAGSAAAAAVVLALAPELVAAGSYDRGVLATGVALWMAVAGLRILPLPESVLLQAAGSFRGLARTSVLSAVVSVLAVALALLLAGPLWSVAGLVLGQAAFMVALRRQFGRWRAAGPLAPPEDGAPSPPAATEARLRRMADPRPALRGT
ncbi:hypothetical protein QMO56_25485 [Roseomonas sp. E05]|uniref:hypothetical protein n=1 Tax=Roseomonas sp. E05 TaxID=3046310 RepID=UPI0024BAC2AA|nr:hypothetical protein [Roseomonas sp. E05]MDJ0391461.1 hypothetical protein [Roseomonas sp. E05]